MGNEVEGVFAGYVLLVEKPRGRAQSSGEYRHKNPLRR
jgi:hypothetical protein